MVSEEPGAENGTGSLSRRAFVRLGTGSVAAAAATGSGAVGSAGAQTSHTVDMTDGLVFDPDELTIAPGDTVVWETVGSVGHSVTAYEDGIPGEAEYFASGGFDSEDAARNAYPQEGDVASGETYEHTFEVEGEYEYFCIPHESAGMVASLTVQEGGGGGGDGGDGGGGGGPPPVPESARTLALATMFSLLSVLGLVYFFMKYGGDYGTEEE